MEQYNERVIRAWLRSLERKIVLGLVQIPKGTIHEYEAVVEGEASPQPEISAHTEKLTPAQAASGAVVGQVITDGGNHRQGQPQPQTFVRSMAQRAPQPGSSSAGGNLRGNRAITQWLIANSKTPFDGDLDLGMIAQDTRLDVGTVRDVLIRMRSVRPNA